MDRPINQSINRSSINQSIDPSIDPSVTHSLTHSLTGLGSTFFFTLWYPDENVFPREIRVGHTDSESTQHVWFGKNSLFYIVLLTGFEPQVLWILSPIPYQLSHPVTPRNHYGSHIIYASFPYKHQQAQYIHNITWDCQLIHCAQTRLKARCRS